MTKHPFLAALLAIPLVATATPNTDDLIAFAANEQLAGNIGFNCASLENEIFQAAALSQVGKTALLAQYREAEKMGALWGVEQWYRPLMELNIPASEASNVRHECEQQVDLMKEGRQPPQVA